MSTGTISKNDGRRIRLRRLLVRTFLWPLFVLPASWSWGVVDQYHCFAGADHYWGNYGARARIRTRFSQVDGDAWYNKQLASIMSSHIRSQGGNLWAQTQWESGSYGGGYVNCYSYQINDAVHIYDAQLSDDDFPWDGATKYYHVRLINTQIGRWEVMAAGHYDYVNASGWSGITPNRWEAFGETLNNAAIPGRNWCNSSGQYDWHPVKFDYLKWRNASGWVDVGFLVDGDLSVTGTTQNPYYDSIRPRQLMEGEWVTEYTSFEVWQFTYSC